MIYHLCIWCYTTWVTGASWSWRQHQGWGRDWWAPAEAGGGTGSGDRTNEHPQKLSAALVMGTALSGGGAHASPHHYVPLPVTYAMQVLDSLWSHLCMFSDIFANIKSTFNIKLLESLKVLTQSPCPQYLSALQSWKYFIWNSMQIREVLYPCLAQRKLRQRKETYPRWHTKHLEIQGIEHISEIPGNGLNLMTMLPFLFLVKGYIH